MSKIWVRYGFPEPFPGSGLGLIKPGSSLPGPSLGIPGPGLGFPKPTSGSHRPDSGLPGPGLGLLRAWI